MQINRLFAVAQRSRFRWRSALHGQLGVPGLQIGYEHTFTHQVADFLTSLDKGTPAHPTFRDALETQRVATQYLLVPKRVRGNRV